MSCRSLVFEARLSTGCVIPLSSSEVCRDRGEDRFGCRPPFKLSRVRMERVPRIGARCPNFQARLECGGIVETTNLEQVARQLIVRPASRYRRPTFAAKSSLQLVTTGRN